MNRMDVAFQGETEPVRGIKWNFWNFNTQYLKLNGLGGLNSRLDIVEDKTVELEDRSIEKYCIVRPKKRGGENE